MGLASPWTGEVCQFMADNWSRYSRSEMAGLIGERFGFQVTRDAVAGKGHRLGLVDGRTAEQINEMARSRAARAYHLAVQRKERSRAPSAAPKPSLAERIARAIPAERVEPLHLTLLQLKDGQCRYVCSGDEPRDYTFCGHPSLSGVSYCAFHSRRCFLPGNRARANA